jgi:hypothetical protein
MKNKLLLFTLLAFPLLFGRATATEQRSSAANCLEDFRLAGRITLGSDILHEPIQKSSLVLILRSRNPGSSRASFEIQDTRGSRYLFDLRAGETRDAVLCSLPVQVQLLWSDEEDMAVTVLPPWRHRDRRAGE